MKFPFWKKLASYFTDIYIESSSSELNDELHIILSKGRLQLCSANAIYSYGDLYKNFSLLFDRLDFSFLKQTKVLILGFGLGSIPILLEKKTDTDLLYVGIEKDEEVIYLANKYIIDEIKGAVQMVSADANAFVQSCLDQYELVIIDVFIDDVIPVELLTSAFLEKIKNLLISENSLVIMNTLANDEQSLKNSRAYFNNIFKKNFPKSEALTLHKNLMLISNSQNLLNY